MGGAHSVNLVGPKKLSRAAGPLPTKFMADPQWVTTIHNVGGLACILGLRGPNNQVSLTTEERGARFKGASPRARGGKGALAPSCCVPRSRPNPGRICAYSILFRNFDLLRPQVYDYLTCDAEVLSQVLTQVGGLLTCGGRRSII